MAAGADLDRIRRGDAAALLPLQVGKHGLPEAVPAKLPPHRRVRAADAAMDAHLCRCGCVGRHAAQLAAVAFVHADDEVEMLEVSLPHGA